MVVQSIPVKDFEDIGILHLPQGFVEEICLSEFTEKPSIDNDFPKVVTRTVRELNDKIRKWQGQRTDESLWRQLLERGISAKAIQSWIYYVVCLGLARCSVFNEKIQSLLAAELYLLLLKEPGSHGNQFFHDVLYENCLNCFKMAAHVNVILKEVNRHRKKKPPANPARAIVDDSSDDEEENHPEPEVMTSSQRVAILDELVVTLRDMCDFVQRFSLKDYQQSLNHSMEVLVEITSDFEAKAYNRACLERDAERLDFPDELAYKVLSCLVNSKHGNLNEMARAVLLKLFTSSQTRMAGVNCSSSSIPRAVLTRASSVCFFASALHHLVGEPVHAALHVFLQNIVAQCRDKTEFRQHMSVCVSLFVAEMPPSWEADFVAFICKLATQNKIGYVLNSLHVMGNLLRARGRSEAGGDLTEDELYFLCDECLLHEVLKLVTDIAPSVRARALLVLCSVFDSAATPVHLIERILTTLCGESAMERLPDDDERRGSAEYQDHASDSTRLAQMLSAAVQDEKSVVRKAGLQAIDKAMCKSYILPTRSALKSLKLAARDTMLSVRKLALQSINNVLTAHPSNELVRCSWFKCAFTSIVDTEVSLEEKCSQIIESQILKGIQQSGAHEELAWSLLAYMSTEKGYKYRTYLAKVMKQWHGQAMLSVNFRKKVCGSLAVEERKVTSWMLLRTATMFVGDKLTASHVARHFRDTFQSAVVKIDQLETLGQLSCYIAPEEKLNILDELKTQISSYSCPVQLVGYTFECVTRLSLDDDQLAQDTQSWYKSLLDDNDTWLHQVVIATDGANYDEQILIKRLHVSANAAQRCPDHTPKRLLRSIQAFLTSPTNTAPEAADPSSQQQSQPLSQFRDSGVPALVRSHAITALGKICLLNDALAKKCVPAIARELDSSTHVSIRNNALIILCDLAAIQTQTTDPYLNEMSNCLRDESALVRTQCLVLISSLLKREYIKWKGNLLFKFLFLVCDESPQASKMARRCLLDEVLKRPGAAGELFYRSFVAALFYLNAYDNPCGGGSSGGGYTAPTQRERSLFNISGACNSSKRLSIYKFLLEQMEDDHRINLTGKLCVDVLEAFVEGSIPLNDGTKEILTDALSVLCCKENRLKCLRAKEGDGDIDIEEVPSSQQATAAASALKKQMQQKIISQVVKRNMIENIFPIIISLKNMLLERRSALVKHVMLYLQEVMREYRTEVDSMLTNDKQLASEIEFDLRRFERETEAEKTSRTATPVCADRNKRMSTALETSGGCHPHRANLANPQPCLTTPATARRKKRRSSLNVEAIINSTRKSAPNSALYKSGPAMGRDPPGRPPDVNRALMMSPLASAPKAKERVASTPCVRLLNRTMDITFAHGAADISAIDITSLPQPHPNDDDDDDDANAQILLPHPERLEDVVVACSREQVVRVARSD